MKMSIFAFLNHKFRNLTAEYNIFHQINTQICLIYL
jgi:hypothetical protein